MLRGEYVGSVSVDRFRREIEILSRLHHPHIVAFYDSGEFNGAPWYAMAYVAGESLRERLDREGPLPIVEALRIARCVAEALAHAHAADIVHRDIKPANILLKDGDVLVADFGIARAVGQSATQWKISSSGLQIGTLTYMSPEQASAEFAIDGRADIYSLGCVLYEMLAGQPPFTAPTATALTARHLIDPVPPLTTVRRSVPPSVAEVVYRALAKSPADRFANADEFAKALEAVAHDPSVSVAQRPKRWRRAAAGAAAAAGITALVWAAWAASVRTADARAVAAADSTRLAVFPFEREAGATAALPAEPPLREALLRWSGVQVVDPFALQEAIGAPPGSSIPASQARALALQLHAGRYVRGTLSRDGASVRAHAMLFDVARGAAPLFEATETLPADSGASRAAAFDRLADRLLFRLSDLAAAVSFVGTASLPARQAFLQGQGALDVWDLDAADSAFARATHLDAKYPQASMWLALTRIWSERDDDTWRYAAEAAAAGRSQLAPDDQAKADAITALARGDRPRACAIWDALTRSEPFSFAAWYGAADCLVRDKVVLPDSKSPSGWRFRSGYHSALVRYRRAFELRPAVLGALRGEAFGGVRELLWTSGNGMRLGRSSGAHAEMFLAYPSWDGDTLCLVPFPYSIVGGSDPRALRKLPRSVNEAVQHQRMLFRDIATGWASSNPRSADAAEAVALALFLLGDPSAIDTLMRAKAIATTASERQRVVATEVWMRVQLALPKDVPALRAARELADSLLHHLPVDPVDPQMLASIAALTGHAYEAIRLDRSNPAQVLVAAATPVRALSRTLALFAAFGGPEDSLLILEHRTDSLINALAPPEQRQASRAEALGRADVLAFPTLALPSVRTLSPGQLYLLDADAAFLRQDTVRARQILADLRAERAAFTLPELTLDAVYPEAWLIASMGDSRGAIAWLDPTLVRLRVSSSLVDPVGAAMMVRAMAFRAELAARVGDGQTAVAWSAAVAELWAHADEFLQPTVDRMRRLAKGGS
jgi:hypothetical protein